MYHVHIVYTYMYMQCVHIRIVVYTTVHDTYIHVHGIYTMYMYMQAVCSLTERILKEGSEGRAVFVLSFSPHVESSAYIHTQREEVGRERERERGRGRKRGRGRERERVGEREREGEVEREGERLTVSL